MKSWYAIRNQAERAETEISLFNEIGLWGITAQQFISDLANIPAQNHITLRIHSPGGDVFDGVAIHAALMRHPGGVTTQIEGIAASMASIIALSGSPIKMTANGWYMLHNPAGGTFGESDEMRTMADLLDGIKDNLVRVYSAKSGLPEEEISAMMEKETWLSADKAKELGFVDEITEALPLSACAFPRMQKFRSIPSALYAVALTPPADQMPENHLLPEAAEVIESIEPATEPSAPAAEPSAPVVEPTEPAEPSEPAAPVVEPPQARVQVDAFLERINTLQASLTAETSARAAAEQRATTAEASLAAVSESLSRLEKSLGLAPASVVPEIVPTAEAAPDPVAEWQAAHEAGDRERAAELFAKHKDAIFAARKKLSKS